MPIHNVGYRGWMGKLTAPWTRWRIIAETGVSIAMRSQWIKRMLFVSWLPVLYLGIGFFFFEKMVEQNELSPNRIAVSTVQELTEAELEFQELRRSDGSSNVPPDLRGSNSQFLQFMTGTALPIPKIDRVFAAIRSGDTRVARRTTWNWLLMTFMRYPQGTMMLFMMGLIVPPLISRDLRSRAYLMYFSKPIGRMEYIMGKLAIPACFLIMITAIPAFALYAFGVMLSPDFSVLLDTWFIPIRILVSTAVLVIPASTLALMYSSLTQESRFAGFAWFATWSLGGCAYMIIWGFRGPLVFDSQAQPTLAPDSNWSVISIYHSIGRVQEWIFGLESDPLVVMPSVLVLLAITVFSFLILYRNVSAPIKA